MKPRRHCLNCGENIEDTTPESKDAGWEERFERLCDTAVLDVVADADVVKAFIRTLRCAKCGSIEKDNKSPQYANRRTDQETLEESSV